MTPRISIVVPVRDDRERLLRCLASIRQSASAPDAPPVEIIVADNGSNDGSDRAAAAAGARVLRLAGEPVSVLRNRAAAAARAPLLAFIDADHEIDAGWMAAAPAAVAAAGVGAAGASYETPSDATWVQRVYGGLRRHVAAPCDVDWLPSGNLVVRRDAFERLRGFDARLDTCEDVDLCARLRAAGYRLVHDPRLRSVHHGDPATLGALFRGELWRGRDNLRVTLRRAASMRELPSVVIPILDLVLLIVAAAGLAAVSSTGWCVAAGALSGIGAMAVLRAGIIAGRLGPAMPPPAGARALAVAAVYDAARALALVARVSHRARRRT